MQQSEIQDFELLTRDPVMSSGHHLCSIIALRENLMRGFIITSVRASARRSDIVSIASECPCGGLYTDRETFSYCWVFTVHFQHEVGYICRFDSASNLFLQYCCHQGNDFVLNLMCSVRSYVATSGTFSLFQPVLCPFANIAYIKTIA